ncbi:MAG TPA: transposase [Pirellulaceae bacterium]|nr:transposase [Pirellulaceae bacterium]
MSCETITRRNLPHWCVPCAIHFVTFRLAGSLPRDVIDGLKQRRRELLSKASAGVSASEHRQRAHKLLFAAYDDYLDSHRQIDWLLDPRIAALVRSSLYHLHGKKIVLWAYSIMPNHVHALFAPMLGAENERQALDDEIGENEDRGPLAGIMHSLKGYTAHQANKILGRSGAFWQHESYDHWIRDENELERVVDYISANAVKAQLAQRTTDWYWCSAHDRFLTDGDSTGWLNLPLPSDLAVQSKLE